MKNALPIAAEIEREGRRILRCLALDNAILVRNNARRFAVKTAERSHPVTYVATAIVDAFLRRGWISKGVMKAGEGAREGEENEIYVVTAAGLGWLRRVFDGDNAFAGQHQSLNLKKIKDHNGNERCVTVNEAESPLVWLRSRVGPDGKPLVNEAQLEAGERLRFDYTLARLTPRLAMDLAAPVLGGSRGLKLQQALTETVTHARQRMRHALQFAGPGLADLLLDVCCHLVPLPQAEFTRGWPKRSGRVVLSLALDRLAMHYGLSVQGPMRARMRAWRAEQTEKAEESA